MIIQGTFTSVWDGGEEITTSATLDTNTGYVEANAVEADVEVLEREYFTDSDGCNYEVCTYCHEYIMKTVMVEGVGKQLHEVQVCSDSYCESHV